MISFAGNFKLLKVAISLKSFHEKGCVKFDCSVWFESLVHKCLTGLDNGFFVLIISLRLMLTVHRPVC